ncbi:oxidoreductase ucpA [Glonium stellatum]|uniref:Oxidoreductase ucpA n=1 Tax=Glonium stellatum TaxID=574774 RepID=A0A8E2JRX2_9PEZI|nr:oxidoreductase ucpA [Glonium stellatum]
MPFTKVALVTAGSAGLGAAIARVLVAEAEMRVVINYSNDAERATQLINELHNLSNTSSNRSSGDTRFLAIKADVGQRSEVQRLIEQTVSAMGRLDVVVSNAGWTRVTNFMNLDEAMVDDDWDHCFSMNVKSHLHLFLAASDYLKKTEGAFVTTASVAGVKPSGSSLAYAVTKAAQIHLAKSLAFIAAPSIRVNCISPGILLTDWGLKFPPQQLESTRKQNKLQIFATVEDVANQVKVFALSKSITGQNAIIDAGFSL